MTQQKTPEQILLKSPFKRAIPGFNWTVPMITNGASMAVYAPIQQFQLVNQDQFLAEYDPSGHKINDDHYYANRLKKDDDGNPYIHFVERVSIPFQSIITAKQLTHLAGNDIQFTDATPKPTQEQKDLVVEFKQAWLLKNMEVGMHEAFEMEKITGDCAFCGYIDKGEFGWRVFGFKNNEILYPHYDQITGKLNLFGRRYNQMADDNSLKNYLDVWDDTYLTTYSMESTQQNPKSTWSQADQQKHGFDKIPIAYQRNDMGACWSLSQDCIDKYELAVSQLCENNKAYAFRIMFLKGDEISISNVDSSGQPSVITGDKDSDAKFMEKADASDSFKLQLEILLKNLFLSSFVVIPPEVKGGDLPGVTIKILYSPAVEQAMQDAVHWNKFVDDVVRIFKFGWGVESKKSAQFTALNVRGTIIPYVHQNDMEIITALNQSVTMGTLSVETATAKHPYAQNDEYAMVEEEKQSDQSVQIPHPLNKNNQNRQNAGI